MSRSVLQLREMMLLDATLDGEGIKDYTGQEVVANIHKTDRKPITQMSWTQGSPVAVRVERKKMIQETQGEIRPRI